MLKKIVSLILIAAIAVNSATLAQSAAEVSDQCGPDCTYTLSEDGTLTISGTGMITKKFKDDDSVVQNIKRIVIEEGIREIGFQCFRGLNYHTDIEVSLPDTLISIGKEAFFDSRIKDPKFPDGLKKIGDEAFEYCMYLDEIVLPDSVEELGKTVFARSSVREIRLPDRLRILPYATFSQCEKLEEIEWPQNLVKIESYAFNNCQFKEFEIPDTVKRVEEKAFYTCEELKAITVGKSVKNISKEFVSECCALKKIVNRSKIKIPLDTLEGKRSWYVGKKRVKKLKPGKTAKADYQKYKIKYVLDGGKIVGKKPKTYTYHQRKYLPSKVKKNGYVFLGWILSTKMERELFSEYIPENLYGKLTAKAILKKYKVSSKNGKIKVTVKDKNYGKKGYKADSDAYYFRYSKNRDMSDSVIVAYTAPYGNGLSEKLKKGKTYYVQIARCQKLDMEDGEDYEEPLTGWHCKRKVTIK